ncbi:hypothetical protein [Kitasatospora sp. NPDC058218]|uniref:hypothetical protein n=1 Tax=Kitasatospora sp. NPDC058218 TaxID=3346385 RepID=UPI0036DE2498
MRANHATKAPGPVRRADGAARRPGGRWLPRPRVVAAGGALLAQLWGLGASGAYAAATGPLPEPVSRTVGRTLGDPALDEESAGHPAGAAGQDAPAHESSAHSPGQTPAGQAPSDQTGQAGPGQAASPGVLGQLADPAVAAVPVPGLDAATVPVGDLLQDRIRAGGLPLPGQRASVPDAFAIASGLLGTAPAQTRSGRVRASRDGDSGGPAAEPRRAGGSTAPTTQPAPAAGGPHDPAAAAPVQEPADRRDRTAGQPGPDGPEATARAAAADHSAPHENLAVPGPATAPAGYGLAGTGTAVLAPIAAGLLLTGAAMCKHRGLPRGH